MAGRGTIITRNNFALVYLGSQLNAGAGKCNYYDKK